MSVPVESSARVTSVIGWVEYSFPHVTRNTLPVECSTIRRSRSRCRTGNRAARAVCMFAAARREIRAVKRDQPGGAVLRRQFVRARDRIGVYGRKCDVLGVRDEADRRVLPRKNVRNAALVLIVGHLLLPRDHEVAGGVHRHGRRRLVEYVQALRERIVGFLGIHAENAAVLLNVVTVVGVVIATPESFHVETPIKGTSVQAMSPVNSMLNVRRPFGSAAVFTDVTLTVGIVIVTVRNAVVRGGVIGLRELIEGIDDRQRRQRGIRRRNLDPRDRDRLGGAVTSADGRKPVPQAASVTANWQTLRFVAGLLSLKSIV